jgi:hypothetical protein
MKQPYMLKKEHLYTWDENDRIVELNKIRITKIPIKRANENEQERAN